MRTRVKFCGCTSAGDALSAVELGVDAIGLVFAPSPRQVSLETARAIAREVPPLVAVVGVFADPTGEEIAWAREAVPNMLVQLSGRESPEQAAAVGAAIKAIHVDPAGEPAARLRLRAYAFAGMLPLFDTRVAGVSGGSGVTFAWGTLAEVALETRIAIAGGLTPENVGACVRAVRPYAVDVRSGVETEGRKDRAKMQAFLAAVRESDET